MSAVGSLNALCPAIGFVLGGTIAALSSPRVAMLVAGAVATLATVAFMRLPHRREPASLERGRHEPDRR